MQVFVCPREWTHATERFTPEHMLSLQNPGADVSALRPPWVVPENHYVAFFLDVDVAGHREAPGAAAVGELVAWLAPRCGPGSEARLLIHCDAGLGRSPAAAYVAWAIHLGSGREAEAFVAMRRSCLETRLVPNTILVAHADAALGRGGALRRPLTAWNDRVPWRRTFR